MTSEKIFADNLNDYMKKRNITPTKLANKVGVSSTAVFRWRAGQTIPRMDKLDKICDILSCNRADLLESPEQMEERKKNYNELAREIEYLDADDEKLVRDLIARLNKNK